MNSTKVAAGAVAVAFASYGLYLLCGVDAASRILSNRIIPALVEQREDLKKLDVILDRQDARPAARYSAPAPQ